MKLSMATRSFLLIAAASALLGSRGARADVLLMNDSVPNVNGQVPMPAFQTQSAPTTYGMTGQRIEFDNDVTITGIRAIMTIVDPSGPDGGLSALNVSNIGLVVGDVNVFGQRFDHPDFWFQEPAHVSDFTV